MLTACDRTGGNSSDSQGSSDTSGQSEVDTSSEVESGLSAMPEWDYVNSVRDGYETYFISSNDAEDGLPYISGNLLVPSLKDALADDSSGKLRGKLEEFVAESDLGERIKLTDEILNLLCKTDEITGENEFFSLKKLAIIEDFWGTGEEFPEPTSTLTAAPLEEAYRFLTERYCMAMIGSQISPYIGLIGNSRGDDGKSQIEMGDYNKKVFEDFASGALTEKQLADNVLYLAYYGVLKDKDLTMLEEFRAYAAANSPEGLAIINAAANEAAGLFSGINGVTITEVNVETSGTSTGQ